MYLKRYHKALDCISRCTSKPLFVCLFICLFVCLFVYFVCFFVCLASDHFDECIALIKDQSLYKLALQLFIDQKSSEHLIVNQLFGEYLMREGQYLEAGISKYNNNSWYTVQDDLLVGN